MELPEGLILVQVNPNYAANLGTGFLYWQHPDGQWVTQRKLTDCEIMQVEDQQLYGIVHHGGQVLVTKSGVRYG